MVFTQTWPHFFTHDMSDNTQKFWVRSATHYPLGLAIPAWTIRSASVSKFDWGAERWHPCWGCDHDISLLCCLCLFLRIVKGHLGLKHLMQLLLFIPTCRLCRVGAISCLGYLCLSHITIAVHLGMLPCSFDNCWGSNCWKWLPCTTICLEVIVQNVTLDSELVLSSVSVSVSDL